MESFQILVVDDEEPIRMLWERFLERWGYPFTLAENGRVALDLARQSRFDLVITDLTMPEMSGSELIYQLKEEQPEVEIIVTTGHATVEIAVELMKAGAFDFLTKPISFQHAEVVIQKCREKLHQDRETLRLLQANRDLEELNRVKEKFITITNHELRTPVSVINSVLEILGRELKDQELAGLARIIQRSAQQLNEIVGQMHEISGLRSPVATLQMSHFRLREAVEEVLEEHQLALEKRHQVAVCRVPAELVVKADRVKLKKVIRELVQNAIKFSHDGREIVISAQAGPAQQIELQVTDSGVGIAEAEIDKIFHLFYEAGDSMHHHTSRDGFMGGGMGVGLSIVQDIVQAHQGRVKVSSKVGEGSTFTVQLPLDGTASSTLTATA